MSEARFKPRSFLTVPSAFGQPKLVEWVSPNLAAEPGWSGLDHGQQLRATARMRAEFLAAQIQHRHATTMRTAMKNWVLSPEQTATVREVFAAIALRDNRGRSPRGRRQAGAASRTQRYAVLTGTSYDRLMKMLRGEIVMRLEDMAIADSILGTNLSGMRRDTSRR